MRKAYRTLRKRVLRLAKHVTLQPGRYPRASKFLYPFTRFLAKWHNVDPLFLERADEIRSEMRSDLTAIQFVRFLTSLNRNGPAGSIFYDFPSMLSTDVQKDAVRQIITARLKTVRNQAKRYLLELNLMRLDDVQPSTLAVRELAGQMIDESVATFRAKGHKSRDKHFTTQDAQAALFDLKYRFDKAGKRFFLDRGTLLGAVREAGFIGTDYDIDLGVLETDITLDEVEALLLCSDFSLVQKNPWKLAYVSDLGIQVDIFLTCLVDGMFVSRGEAEVHQWNFRPFDLVPLSFLERDFYVPENPEDQLTQTYGNWQDRTLFYDPSFDEPCVSYSPNLNSMMYLVLRLKNALSRRDRFVAEACLKALRDDFGIDRTDLIGRPATVTERKQ